MDIEKVLRRYRENKGKIGTAEERCKYWQHCLDTMSPDEIAREFEYMSENRYGMPKAKNNNSPVESAIVSKEVTREMVKQWIIDDESRMRPLKFEIKQIDIGLGSLTEEENYIITTKCIDNWKWKQVEIGFNQEYRNKTGTDITEIRLKQLKIEILKKMDEIINK